MGKCATDSDVFGDLGNVTRPVLFMHGEKDDICPVSQSYVGYRALRTQGVPTGLIVYKGEKHGFNGKGARRHRDRSMLEWFGRYLPITPKSTGEGETAVTA